MSFQMDNNSLAIIGTGLVGGAVLREFVVAWVRTHESANTHVSAESKVINRLKLGKIFITAAREPDIAYQLDKLEHVLSRERGIAAERSDHLRLTVKIGDRTLTVEAEPLNIIPEGLTNVTLDDEVFRKRSAFYAYIRSKNPAFLVIGANLASLIAYGPAVREDRTLALIWTLTTLKRAVDESDIEAVAIVGTTALGGQGTNLVWTHQSHKEMDPNQTAKILAAYGILGVVDRIHWDTDSAARYILLIPGSLLGYDDVDYGSVRYFSIPDDLPPAVEEVIRHNDLRVPIYEPIKVDLTKLSDERIDWEARREKDAFLCGAKLKCGETGDIAPLQFACISHAFQMGFNTDAYIGKILVSELAGEPTGYNQIPLGSGRVIDPTPQGQNERDWALARLAAIEAERNVRSCPVYPALGSARAQKEIVLADLVHRFLTERSGEATVQQLAAYDASELAGDLWAHLQGHRRLLTEIIATIPVVSPSGEIYIGPNLPYLSRGVTRTSDLADLAQTERFRKFVAIGAVDLRPVGERVVCDGNSYDTGVKVLVARAQSILDNLASGHDAEAVAKHGSAMGWWVRRWSNLTSGSRTALDPVDFVLQFLGGERPFV